MSNTPTKRGTTTPTGLCKQAQALWRQVTGDYEFEQRHRDLLEAACRQLTRSHQLEANIAELGCMTHDRFGSPKANPAVTEQRAAHLAFLKLLAALGLDDADLGGELRRSH